MLSAATKACYTFILVAVISIHSVIQKVGQFVSRSLSLAKFKIAQAVLSCFSCSLILSSWPAAILNYLIQILLSNRICQLGTLCALVFKLEINLFSTSKHKIPAQIWHSKLDILNKMQHPKWLSDIMGHSKLAILNFDNNIRVSIFHTQTNMAHSTNMQLLCKLVSNIFFQLA